MKYLYQCHGEIMNSYISAVNNTLVKTLKERYRSKVMFNFTAMNGVAKYRIRAEVNVEDKSKLLKIQEDMRYDEIRIGVIYKKWSEIK